MPLLREEADKLSNDSLQRGVVEVIIERGARDLLMFLPFKGFEGRAYAYNMEKTLPTDSSARDPYGNTDLPGGVGTRERITVTSQMLSRNADTAEIDIFGKSDINDARTNDTILAAKKLAQDFMEQFFHGMGKRYNMSGVEYWVDYYPTVNADFAEQVIYNTDTQLATGTPASLSINAIDDLVSRYKGDRFDLIVSNRATWVEYRRLLEQAGGLTPEMIMLENFGRPVPAHDGIPWLILDPVGKRKVTSAASYDHTGGAEERLVTVDTTDDPYFLGFSSLDVGSKLTFANAEEGTIESVVSENQVTLTAGDNPGADVAKQAAEVAAKNVIYSLTFDEDDAVTAIFHSVAGSGQPQTGEYYGPIGGFDAEDLGLLEEKPLYRTRLKWYGNFVVHNPYAVARLSHFTIGASS